MKLYSNTASPFARKCRVVAHELGLKLEEIRTLPVQDENFRRINPLGKIPALVLDDGTVLIDSPVICEYLNDLGGGKFFPGTNIFKHNSGRWKALGLQALGDGLADAAVAWIVLGRENPPPQNTRSRQTARRWPAESQRLSSRNQSAWRISSTTRGRCERTSSVCQRSVTSSASRRPMASRSRSARRGSSSAATSSAMVRCFARIVRGSASVG